MSTNYVKLLVPEHLYLRCLAWLGTAEEEHGPSIVFEREDDEENARLRKILQDTQDQVQAQREVSQEWQRKYDELARVLHDRDPGGYIQRRLDRAGITWEQMVADVGEDSTRDERFDYADAALKAHRAKEYEDQGVQLYAHSDGKLHSEPEQFDTDDSYPDFGPAEDAAAGMGLPTPVTGTTPEPPAEALTPPSPEPARHPGRATDEERAEFAERLAAAGLIQNDVARALDLPSSHVTGVLTGSRSSRYVLGKVLDYVRTLPDAPAPETPPPSTGDGVDLVALRQLQEFHGLTQAKFGEALGVTQSVMSRLYRRVPQPKYGDLAERALAYLQALPEPGAETAPEPEPERVVGSDGKTPRERLYPAELEAVADRWVADTFQAEEGALLLSADLPASYAAWAAKHDAPDVSHRLLGGAMRRAGYVGKVKFHGAPLNKSAQTYVNTGLRPAEEPPKPTPKEPAPGSPEDIRQKIERAKAARAAAAIKTELAVVEEEQERRDANNGWHQPIRTDAVIADLTLEEIQAEMAKATPARREGYTGPRPSGSNVDGETKDLTNAVLDLNVGWRYEPPSGAQTKGVLIAPDGSRFKQASSMGGSVGRIGNNREVRRYLSRKGYLPTAAAPVSQLTAPRENDRRDPLSGVTAGEDDPGADPISADQVDLSAFDLYEDVKAGLPDEFVYQYHPLVLGLAGLDQTEVDAAVRNPQYVEIRPETKEKKYPVIGFQRGDMRVILGFRNMHKPAVIAAYWTTLLAHDTYRVDRHPGGGARKASGLPSNPAAVVKRLRLLGAKIEESGKTASVAYCDQDLGQITVGPHVPKLTVQTDYQRCLRKMHAIDQRQKVGANA